MKLTHAELIAKAKKLAPSYIEYDADGDQKECFLCGFSDWSEEMVHVFFRDNGLPEAEVDAHPFCITTHLYTNITKLTGEKL